MLVILDVSLGAGDVARCWWFFTVQLGTPRGRYDKHSSKFFPQKETKVYRIQEKVNTPEGDAD
jgi:hypothetical protein